jgi:hypothetical protein
VLAPLLSFKQVEVVVLVGGRSGYQRGSGGSIMALWTRRLVLTSSAQVKPTLLVSLGCWTGTSLRVRLPPAALRWSNTFCALSGYDELRVLEIIVPGGIEALFRRLAEPGGEYSPDTLPGLAAEYGAEVDFEATMSLVERHGLVV